MLALAGLAGSPAFFAGGAPAFAVDGEVEGEGELAALLGFALRDTVGFVEASELDCFGAACP